MSCSALDALILPQTTAYSTATVTGVTSFFILDHGTRAAPKRAQTRRRTATLLAYTGMYQPAVLGTLKADRRTRTQNSQPGATAAIQTQSH
eukprot:415001-Rhodomonas_salina.1